MAPSRLRYVFSFWHGESEQRVTHYFQLEIVDSGPRKPPPDFWCLITVRDRLISQSNVLYDYIKQDSEEAWQLLQSSIRISAPLSCLSLM